jgi:hypothetical protein
LPVSTGKSIQEQLYHRFLSLTVPSLTKTLKHFSSDTLLLIGNIFVSTARAQVIQEQHRATEQLEELRLKYIEQLKYIKKEKEEILLMNEDDSSFMYKGVNIKATVLEENFMKD